MGRLKKEKTGTFDRIGEVVNLEKCPVCDAHPDCFACMDRKCTALNACEGKMCTFYKPAGQVELEDKKIYAKLKEAGRYDLIDKYAGTFSALGVFDDEIEVLDRTAAELEAFGEADLLAEMIRETDLQDEDAHSEKKRDELNLDSDYTREVGM